MHLPARLQWCPPVRELWRRQDVMLRAYRVNIGLSATLAATLLLSAPSRFSAPGWAIVRILGGQYVWGAFFVVSAAALVAGPRTSLTLMRVALRTVAAVYLSWTVTFVIAAQISDGASLVGAALCAFAACLHISQAESYRELRAGATA